MPTDGSPTAGHALSEAVGLATITRARIRLLHVLDWPLPYAEPTINTVYETLRQSGLHLLGQAVEQVRQAHVEVEGAIAETLGQRTSDVIVDDAHRWGADLVVMGTHGRHGVGRLLLGSVAEGVARSTTVPVLLVRER